MGGAAAHAQNYVLAIVPVPYVPPSEPTGTWDWITLGVLVATSVAMTASCVMLLAWRRRYYSIVSTDVPRLLGAAAFGLVHMWAAFIANGHLEGRLVAVGEDVCMLWMVWGQYFFGLSLWVLLLAQRVINIAYVFQKGDAGAEPIAWLRDNAARRRTQRTLGGGVVLAAAAVCAFVGTLGSRTLLGDPECSLNLAGKAVLCSWTLVLIGAMLALSRRLRRAVHADYAHEIERVRALVRVGVLALIACAVLSVLHATIWQWGRVLFTTIVCALHAYTFAVLGRRGLMAVLCARNTLHDERRLRRYTALLYHSPVNNFINVADSSLGDQCDAELRKDVHVFRIATEAIERAAFFRFCATNDDHGRERMCNVPSLAPTETRTAVFANATDVPQAAGHATPSDIGQALRMSTVGRPVRARNFVEFINSCITQSLALEANGTRNARLEACQRLYDTWVGLQAEQERSLNVPLYHANRVQEELERARDNARTPVSLSMFDDVLHWALSTLVANWHVAYAQYKNRISMNVERVVANRLIDTGMLKRDRVEHAAAMLNGHDSPDIHFDWHNQLDSAVALRDADDAAAHGGAAAWLARMYRRIGDIRVRRGTTRYTKATDDGDDDATALEMLESPPQRDEN